MYSYTMAEEHMVRATRDFPAGCGSVQPSDFCMKTGPRRARAFAVRDFPSGCGPNASQFSSGKKPNVVTGDRGGKRTDNGVYAVCDVPTGCGPHASQIPLAKSRNVISGDSNSGISGTGAVTPEKAKKKPCSSSVSADSWRRPVGAVKSTMGPGTGCVKQNSKSSSPSRKESENSDGRFIVSTGSKVTQTGCSKVGADRSKRIAKSCTGTAVSHSHRVENNEREKMLQLIDNFRKRCSELSFAESDGKKVRRVDIEALNELNHKGFTQPTKRIGPVPGIHVGDQFHYRVELRIVGLHSQLVNGIDYVDDWEKLTSSVVAVEGYSDDMTDANVLIYTGEGGGGCRGKPVEDQKLKNGNLALKNSLEKQSPVRVIRGIKISNCQRFNRRQNTYVYDGLYNVKNCVKKKGPMGNMIYEFELTRQPGQNKVNWRLLRPSSKAPLVTVP